jgi:ChrR Cupin-like domain
MRSVRLPLLTGAVALIISAVASSQTPMQHIVSSKGITWGPSPIPGVQLAVLAGDPSKDGVFTLRLKMPNAWKVPPHWHPGDENLTVIQGTFLLATGEKYDVAALKPMATGDFAHMPKEMRHFALTKGETVIQVSGLGPFVINYVNPEDDPKNRKPSQ